MIQAALSSVASELAAVGKLTATVRNQAEQILAFSPELAAALGGGPVQVVGVLSQGSMTQSVNGALSRRVVMQLMVQSSASGKRAQTSVECDVGADGEVLAGSMTIWAVLESGRRIQVPVHDAGGGGKPIDVHWKRVE
ncbi:hypothetical protein H632_c690p0 [Helicosporidium sp. ATCC 50920]|nr:hypothetical protein H632_c690p0 [Helicosporidium sp. ATCC 50920]|eukprot:KDD75425.1 hypothetical protein H632_c690p0 [Helicosporidium sp. ATCC 50920]